MKFTDIFWTTLKVFLSVAIISAVLGIGCAVVTAPAREAAQKAESEKAWKDMQDTTGRTICGYPGCRIDTPKPPKPRRKPKPQQADDAWGTVTCDESGQHCVGH